MASNSAPAAFPLATHHSSLVTLSLATWNVNSVRSRLPHLLEWLKRDKPDIVLLQETKCTDDTFPAMEIEELGYNVALHGEKSYNGVAILSKFPLEDVTRDLPGGGEDAQTRYIEAVVSLPAATAMRVASVYVPNGQDAASDKFQYKLRFLDRLYAHVQTLLGYQEILAIGGDYNIAPDDSDVHDPKAWEGSVLTHDEVRRRFRKIVHLGMYDAARVASDEWRVTSDPSSLATRHSPLITNHYTWWDYRANAFAADNGLRIDHFLLSPQAADRLQGCEVVKPLRALEKASDHAPVIVSLSF